MSEVSRSGGKLETARSDLSFPLKEIRNDWRIAFKATYPAPEEKLVRDFEQVFDCPQPVLLTFLNSREPKERKQMQRLLRDLRKSQANDASSSRSLRQGALSANRGGGASALSEKEFLSTRTASSDVSASVRAASSLREPPAAPDTIAEKYDRWMNARRHQTTSGQHGNWWRPHSSSPAVVAAPGREGGDREGSGSLPALQAVVGTRGQLPIPFSMLERLRPEYHKVLRSDEGSGQEEKKAIQEMIRSLVYVEKNSYRNDTTYNQMSRFYSSPELCRRLGSPLRGKPAVPKEQ